MLIDEKGRLFGKINIIDFLVILFILVVIPMFFIGSRILGAKKPEVIKAIKKEVIVEVEVKFFNVMPEIAKVIKEGDIDNGDMDNDKAGKPIGKLVKIISVNIDENKFGLATDSNYREIKALVELTCTEGGRYPVYRGYVPKIGSPIGFSTDLYSIQGIIVGVKK